MRADWLAAVREHDARVAQLSTQIWLGAEPTFSRRQSNDTCWTVAATGGDKEDAARRLLLDLAPRLATHFELGRAPGRQYAGEEEPRFGYGMRWQRDGSGPKGMATPATLDAELTPPPPGERVAWLTVTPDPGVVEVNLAPCPDLETYDQTLRATYEAAAAAGLSPYRYLFNGRRVDSGGGGQLTLGGPTPQRSPFFEMPWLLPGLIRYLNHHPSLSYLFTSECAGSASQGPRPDEGVRELFRELGIALDLLRATEASLTPDRLMASLALLLVDCSGNSHRAELNIEKLWNPSHPRGGELGLVELRALRMPATVEQATALAALFRSIATRIALARFDAPLCDHGAALHDRFALPAVLRDDLRAVLQDLNDNGCSVPEPLAAELLRPHGQLGEWTVAGKRLRVTRGVQFWPLLGDVASQEGASSRTVDASAETLEVAVTGGDLWAQGQPVPLSALGDERVAGVHYRTFVPNAGLHPTLPAAEPLRIDWRVGDQSTSIALYAWRPGGGPYDGLPDDAAEAERRCQERIQITRQAARSMKTARFDGTWVLDLRRSELATED